MNNLIPYTFEAEAWKSQVFLEQCPMLLDAARMPLEGKEHPDIDFRAGYSYRMNVGSAFLGASPSDRETAIFSRGNIKPYEGSPKRLCSERLNLGAINNTHFEVAGFALVSTGEKSVVESVEGSKSTTVLPCRKACIPMLEESQRVVDDIVIVTRDVEGRKSQSFTLKGIKRAHDENPELLMSNTVGEFRFYHALMEYKKLVDKALRWTNKPSPADLAVSALLETAF